MEIHRAYWSKRTNTSIENSLYFFLQNVFINFITLIFVFPLQRLRLDVSSLNLWYLRIVLYNDNVKVIILESINQAKGRRLSDDAKLLSGQIIWYFGRRNLPPERKINCRMKIRRREWKGDQDKTYRVFFYEY